MDKICIMFQRADPDYLQLVVQLCWNTINERDCTQPHSFVLSRGIPRPSSGKACTHPCLSTQPDTLRIFSQTRLLATNAANATAAAAVRPFPLSRDVKCARSCDVMRYQSDSASETSGSLRIANRSICGL